MSDPQVDREGFCPTCGQHHLAESDTEELHVMLAKCERLEREVLAENERLREQLRGAVEALRDIATETHAQNSVEGRADDAARMRMIAIKAINRLEGQ